MTQKELSAKSRRPKRPLMDLQGPLACKEIPGYHLRYIAINSPEDSLAMDWAEGQGYEPVLKKEQGLIERSQDAKDSGSDVRRTGKDGVTLLLMKQPIEYYDESIEELTRYNNERLTSHQAKTINSDGLGQTAATINISNHDIQIK